MYSVYGRGASKNADGSITIKVDIVNDQTGASVRVQAYTGASVKDIQEQIRSDLQAMVAAQVDVALSTAVVGKLLGSI